MRALLAAALLTLSAGAQASWSVSADLEAFQWKEDGAPRVTETGPRWGASWGYLRERDSGWQWAYRGQFRRGTIDYDGAFLFSGQHTSARTRYIGVVNELQGIYRFPNSHGVELLGGLGLDYWERNILPDQKEDYAVVFARAGVNIDPRSSTGFFGGFGVKLPVFVAENAHLDELGFDQNETLYPEGNLSGYAQLGYRFQRRWSLIGYYDGYRFGESKAVTTTSAAFPGTQFVIFQPASKVDSWGVKLQYEFR
jgi:hypothetical protein